jgi:hypothetical protein
MVNTLRVADFVPRTGPEEATNVQQNTTPPMAKAGEYSRDVEKSEESAGARFSIREETGLQCVEVSAA